MFSRRLPVSPAPAPRLSRPPFLFALSLWLVASMGFSQSFDPDLGQTLDWLAPPDPVRAEIPADAPERTTYPMAAEPIQGLLDEVPGRPFRILDPPPQSRAWWKYPIYLALGLPRDVVDSFFGFFSYFPILNMPLVLIPYEIVPTQAFLRDPRDWHRWPGTTNRRGHGMLPAKRRVRDARTLGRGTYPTEEIEDSWRFNETWGFFPTAHSVHFTYVSRRKVRRWTEENQQLRLELQGLNQRIDAANRTITDRQRRARTAAVVAIDAGDGREATSQMLPYRLSYPADETAHALLINAMALHGDSGPDWVKPYLWNDIATAGNRVTRQAATLIRTSLFDYPQFMTLAEASVYIQTMLGDPLGALEAAEAAFNVDPRDPRRARLFFEAALTARDDEKSTAAYGAYRAAAETDETATLMSLRLAMLGGRSNEVREPLTLLAGATPENAYFHYYLGCVELSLLDETEEPEKAIQTAFDALERASLSAPTRPLREQVGYALNYARRLAAKESARTPRRDSGFFPFPQ